jgi:hypothetical protein
MNNTDNRSAEHPLAGIPPARIANWNRYGVDAIEADLINNNGLRYVGGPPGTNEQAWRWVRYQRAQQMPQQEVFSLKPTFHGLGIDLKAAAKKLRSWWRGSRR